MRVFWLNFTVRCSIGLLASQKVTNYVVKQSFICNVSTNQKRNKIILLCTDFPVSERTVNSTCFMSLQFWTQTMLFLLSVLNSGLTHMLRSTVTLATTLYRLHCLFCGKSVGDWHKALDRQNSIKMGLHRIIFAYKDVPTRNHFVKLFTFIFAQFSVVFYKLEYPALPSPSRY